MNPAIRRGRWKSEEDEALKNAVNMYGVGNWVKIQKFVLGRTDVQCRERWMNVLSPSVKKDPWTEEEDKELKRTDNQCWRRYKVLINKMMKGNLQQILLVRMKVKRTERATFFVIQSNINLNFILFNSLINLN
ncbi:unnamed protein product [Rhizophagus irregularis]|nr:unnamed protein product [Rhizophagus irregularis]